ncbi:head-tail adaptor [Arthrobacter phage SilentRX]|uniref:Head-to-tail adaptor n=1 Tax=Arthrobacter phage SilentRX TaxID=2836091 RepID=A0A8F3E7V7_9CAUD|nr:head-tail adaptor [Arthrobacter phage SilentRX]QWY82767.1 head-to-tail adaptor [Arthrobacter phage SilentRX]
MTWTFDWPEAASAAKAAADPETVARAEQLAGASLRMLTLNRVGGNPITVMPCNRTCTSPVMRREMFLPMPYLSSADLKSCNCSMGCSCSAVNAVELARPVGDIVEVKVDGVVLDPSEYRVEDGNKLIRNGGKRWPACAGENFTVTYLNAAAVDAMGAYAGGVLAWEWLKAMTDKRNCRLSSRATAVSRQGVSMELTPGLFPEGTTGIEEVDIYVRMWNPHGWKVAPRVYSLDTPRQRQVTFGGF